MTADGWGDNGAVDDLKEDGLGEEDTAADLSLGSLGELGGRGEGKDSTAEGLLGPTANSRAGMSRGGAGSKGFGGSGRRGSLGGDFWVWNSVGMTLVVVGLEERNMGDCSGRLGVGEETMFSEGGDLLTEG